MRLYDQLTLQIPTATPCACFDRAPPPPSPPPQRYPISGYIKLPYALQPFVQLPIMDHVVVVAKPSGDVSGGLENYREASAGGMRPDES